MGATKAAPRTSRVTCPPEHKHGSTATCYCVHKCRCQDCRAHRRDRENARYRQKAYGIYDSGLVDAGPVREHMRMLVAFGMGSRTIAAAAGVGTTAAKTLLYGREDYSNGAIGPRHGEIKQRVKRDIAERILAVQPELKWLGDRRPYPALGTKRRIQALMCLGWSMSELGRRMGMTETSLSRTLRQERTWASVARSVSDLYESMWNLHPSPRTKFEKISVNRTRRYAREHGFVPPLAWDDIDHDPQPPKPPALPGKISEREEAVERLHALRWSDAKIAAEIGATDRTVLRIRQRLGLPGWTKEQQEAAA